MSKLRALVVDDALVMRRLVTEALQRDGLIEVVGTAPNGRVALDRIDQYSPDFVTLDVEMPELDGLQTLREIRRRRPRLPVVMVSLLTQRGASATLDALAAGASDYITKPGDSTGLEASIEKLASELVPKVKALCSRSAPESAGAPATPARRAIRPRCISQQVELVCVATSTGGPNALTTVFDGFTRPLPVPIAIVQHMPPLFTASLAQRLDTHSKAVRCREAKEGDVLQASVAYIAPGGHHLSVTRDLVGRFVAHLTDSPPENSCRPAADVLFRSAAATGASLLGVVMTGMGQDGLRGCEAIHERQGQIVVQDEATSVVWGMPGAVARADLAQAVLPLAQIAGDITRRVLFTAAKSA